MGHASTRLHYAVHCFLLLVEKKAVDTCFQTYKGRFVCMEPCWECEGILVFNTETGVEKQCIGKKQNAPQAFFVAPRKTFHPHKEKEIKNMLKEKDGG